MSFSVYYLPFFRERTFPGIRGRLRFAADVDTDAATYESSLGAFTPSGAARLSFSKGSVDINVGILSGLSREPRFVAELSTGNVAPRYDRMQHASIDAQWAAGGFVLKAEVYARLLTQSFLPYGGGGAGLDYTWSGFLDSWDVTLATEYLADFRPLDAPVTLFKHDVFGAVRVSSSDTASAEATLGAIVDVLDGTTFGRLDVSHRFGDNWRGSVEANVFLGPAGKLPSSFRSDSYGAARVAYFF